MTVDSANNNINNEKNITELKNYLWLTVDSANIDININNDKSITELTNYLWLTVDSANINNNNDKNITELILTLLMTDSCANTWSMSNHTPISSALSATERRVSQTNLWASNRISIQLLSKANKGASGKAQTNIVMKPNWRTKSAAQNIVTYHINIVT